MLLKCQKIDLTIKNVNVNLGYIIRSIVFKINWMVIQVSRLKYKHIYSKHLVRNTIVYQKYKGTSILQESRQHGEPSGHHD